MGLHHNTLKAAVTKYGPLLSEGKTEEEIKAEIAKDEKGFDEDGVNQIYDAIANPEEEESEKAYVVISDFRDIDNFDLKYEAGQDVPESFTKERISNLLDLGLIEEK